MGRQRKEKTKTKAGWNERVDNHAVALLAKSFFREHRDFVFGELVAI